MATQQTDNDEQARREARATLDSLRNKYWNAKKQNPPPNFDDLFDLRSAYEDAAVEYAGLEGRLLRDDILTSDVDLVKLQKVRAAMAEAVEIKEILKVAQSFIKLMMAVV